MKLFLLAFILAGAPNLGDLPEGSPKEKGKWIAFQAEENFDHYGYMTMDVVMHLKKSGRDVISREMNMKVLEIPGEGEKVLMRFLAPADVKGLAFLIWTHKNQFDDLLWFMIHVMKCSTIRNHVLMKMIFLPQTFYHILFFSPQTIT